MLTNKRAYIAGPMTGMPMNNYPEFFRVESILTELGYDAVNPARHTGHTPDEAYQASLASPQEWTYYMRLGLTDLLTCDSICLLDGWWTSRGANCEQAVAAWLRMPFLFPDGSQMETVR